MRNASAYHARASTIAPDRGAEWAPSQFWQAPVPPDLDAPTARGAKLEVYANHGRWVVECPDCHGAQLACLTDHRFMCNSCGNVTVSGQWRAVIWPAGVAAIESMLADRPQSAQNWIPGETREDLLVENIEHLGVRAGESD